MQQTLRVKAARGPSASFHALFFRMPGPLFESEGDVAPDMAKELPCRRGKRRCYHASNIVFKCEQTLFVASVFNLK